MCLRSADAQYTSSVINTNVIVSDNGEVKMLLRHGLKYHWIQFQVVWLSHGIFRSSCDINVEYFPFDLQSCKMKWASWTYDGFQVHHLSDANAFVGSLTRRPSFSPPRNFVPPNVCRIVWEKEQNPPILLSRRSEHNRMKRGGNQMMSSYPSSFFFSGVDPRPYGWHVPIE